LEPFDGSCIGQALSKVCKYVIIDDKMCTDLSYASIKDAQGVIQRCITCPKKSGKGMQAWDKACIDYRLRPNKLNMLMKTR
jgi:hypothetical protein